MERQSRSLGRIIDIFAGIWNFWGGHTGNTSKQQKMAAFSENFHNKEEFEAVLTIFCCYGYNANASKGVQKTATDKKNYRKSSLGVIFCCIAKAYHQ